jgi:hypothetical protein
MQPTNDQVINLAIGRIFRIASRPTQPGDIEEYERCKAIIMDLAEASGHTIVDTRPNYARDYRKGTQGN